MQHRIEPPGEHARSSFDCKTASLDAAGMVNRAFAYYRACQRPPGYLAQDPDELYLNAWDSINAVRSILLWRDVVPVPQDIVDGVLDFLRGVETRDGMLSWGTSDIGSARYCTETSSEYIAALTLLGRDGQARPKALFLRERQLPAGPWEEVHPHIPTALQTVPSVTGFALLALSGLDVEPAYIQEATAFLTGSQSAEGHFGLNAYYCATPYYVLRPVVAALMEFGSYAAAARARDFVLDQQAGDGSWFTTIEGYEDFSSPELHTALALETLAHAGGDIDSPAIHRGVSWLMGRQRPDGSWFGGRYAVPATDNYREVRRLQDVYTTAQALSALRLLAVPERNER